MKNLIILFCALSFSQKMMAQAVGVNTLQPDSSAVLDIVSDSKGVLIPRMSTAQRTAIVRPAMGLLVFDSTLKKQYFYDGSKWTVLNNGTQALNYVGNSYLAQTAGTGSTGTSEGAMANRFNIAIGDSVLHSNTTGYDNIGFGIYTLKKNVTGFSNIAIGKQSLEENTTGSNNIALGTYSLSKNTSGFYNVAIGNNALLKNTTGNYNVTLGQNTLAENTQGLANTAVGYEVMRTNTTGSFNTAMGLSSLRNIQTGNENTAIGYGALNSNTTGSYNTAFGSRALSTNTTGNYNTSLGMRSGFNSVGSNNIFIGYEAGANETGNNKLYIENSNSSTPLIAGDFAKNKVTINDSLQSKYLAMTNGAANGYVLRSDSLGNASWVNANTLTVTETDPKVASATANAIPKWNGTALTDGTIYDNGTNIGIGTNAPLEKLQVAGNLNIESGRLVFTNSQSSVIIGFNAGLNNAGEYNVFAGNESGKSNSTGVYNTFLGSFAGKNNSTGNYNTSTGFGAFENNTTGSANTGLGFYALNKNSTGVENTATGQGALESNTTASRNTATGFLALNKNTTGNNNVALGYKSLEQNTVANFNTGIGYNALLQNTLGEENTSTGAFALRSNTTGDFNAAMGLNALAQNTTGSENVALGYEAGYGNISSDANTYLGHQAGYFNATGSANVFVGYQAGYNETGSNKLYISNSTTANPLIGGDFSTKKVTINDSLQAKYFKLTNGANSGYLLMSDANGNGLWTDRNLLFNNTWGKFGDHIYNSNPGNVGIGNPFPISKLDVAGTGSINANVRSESNAASITVEAPNQNEAAFSIGTFVSNNGVGGITSYSRWKLAKANSNEAGGNTGGDFVLNRFSDVGNYIGQPILITRSNGTVTIGNEGASTTANTLRVNGSVGVKLKTVITSNNNTTMDGTDYMAIYGGTITGNSITIPAASSCASRVYLIINHSSSAVTLNGGINYITANGATSTSVAAGASVQIVSDGTNWHKIN